MKSNAKFVAICLAVVFVLALMCGVLVACNEDADTPMSPDQNPDMNGDDDNPSDSISGLVSNELIEHIIGYVATEGYKDGHSAGLLMMLSDLRYSMGDTYAAKYGDHIALFSLHNGISGSDNERPADIYILDGEAQAKAYYDDMPAEQKSIAKLDGRYIYGESNEGFIKNTLLAATIPSTFSQTCINFIKDLTKVNFDSKLVFASMMALISTNYKSNEEGEAIFMENISCGFNFADTNRELKYAYSKLEDGETYTDEQKAEELDGCTEDSYIDTEREDGYVFMKLFQKTGLHYNDSRIYVEGESVHGLDANSFIYDKSTPKDLTIPAEVDGKRVIGAGIQDSNLVNITLSEGILEMDSFGNNDELTTISLPKSIKNLCSGCPFSFCPKFTTIKYAGTTAEWIALIEANNIDINEDWCKYSHYNEQQHEDEIVPISFTVQCSNGNISYPTAA